MFFFENIYENCSQIEHFPPSSLGNAFCAFQTIRKMDKKQTKKNKSLDEKSLDEKSLDEKWKEIEKAINYTNAMGQGIPLHSYLVRNMYLRLENYQDS